MGPYLTRFTPLTAATAVVAVLSTAGVTGAAVPAAAGQAPQRAGAARASAVPGAQLWVRRYAGTGRHGSLATVVAVSPGGATVFVTGISSQGTFATAAYRAATGTRLWVRNYSGPPGNSAGANSLGVSPDGSRVFVTGLTQGRSADYATVAYSAATGAQLWARLYTGSGENAAAASVAVSRTRVFVTGVSAGGAPGSDPSADDYATVAYSAATGSRLWVRRYDGPGSNFDQATSVAVSPGGRRVYVTGESTGSSPGEDYATVAYSAATGAQLWARRYRGPGSSSDEAYALAVSPSGSTVFVTGAASLAGSTGQGSYVTIAYRVRTGTRQWVRTYGGPRGSSAAFAVAMSPSGRTVFVTGGSAGATSGRDYATVAYRAATGTRLWVRRYNGPGNGNDVAFSVAVSHTGDRVLVTGESPGANGRDDYATIAYRS